MSAPVEGLDCGHVRPTWGECSGCGQRICGACWHHEHGTIKVCRDCYNGKGWCSHG